MKKKRLIIASALLFIAGILVIVAFNTIAPEASNGKEADEAIESVEKRIQQATPVVSDTALTVPDLSGKSGEVLGSIEIKELGVKAALKYGTKDESNLVDGACVTDYSSPEKSFVLGHNYTSNWCKNKIFHGLVNAKKGQKVVIRLLKNKDDKEVVEKYTYKINFSKQYKESDFYADNLKLFTDNQDYDGDYDLALATCNHYKDGTRGRQVVLCSLISD